MIDIRGLSYFVAQVGNLGDWQCYAEDVLGMPTSPAPGGALYVKMDERPFRMLVVEGDSPRYLASGWELAGRRPSATPSRTSRPRASSGRPAAPRRSSSAACRRWPSSSTRRATVTN